MYVTRLFVESKATLAEPPAANCKPVLLVDVNCVALLSFSIGSDVVELVIKPLSLLKILIGISLACFLFCTLPSKTTNSSELVIVCVISVNSDKSITIEKNNEEVNKITAKHVIIATGARSREIPSLKQNGINIIGYRKAMTLEKQPKEIIIVGSGAIGIEFAYFYNSLGSKVTVIEYMPRITPVEDEDISKELEKILKKQGINIMTSAELIESKANDKSVTVKIKKSKDEIIKLKANVVLSAVGIKSNIENLGLENIGIITENDKITVDDFYKTNVEGF